MLGTRLRQATRALGFGALTFGAGTTILVRSSMKQGTLEKARVRDFWSEAWSRSLLRLFAVEAHVHGEPGERGMGRGQGRVVISNHRSIIDIAVLLANFGGAMLSRGDMAKWPIMGKAAAAGGTIFVDRSSKASGAQAIAAMVERLKLDDTICIFPEGTTFADDEVRPFKAGGFVAAMRSGAAVLPVGLVYPIGSGAAFGGESFLAHLGRLAASRSGRVYLEIGREMHPEEGETVEAFAERCRAEVARLVTVGRERERREASHQG